MINIGTLLAVLKLQDLMTPALTRASASLKATGAKLKTIGAGMKSTGTSLTTGLTLPLVAMGAAAGIAFGSFEKNMNKVKALTGETGQAFDDMTQLAKDLGKSTKFSASEAADAMGFLAMAGFNTQEIMGSLPGVLELAASANLGLAESADITTNILTGYGRTVEQVGETNDILVKAFTSANTDLVQLGQAFKFVGPVAKSAGVSFEETTAALSLMGNAGIQASMAGTALRGAITKLLNPTNKARDVMREVGLVATDASGELLPMADIVQQLGERGASTAQLMTIFGLRAGPAMAGLVSQGHGALRKLTGELENAGGIANRVATIQMEGLNGAFIRFKSAAEGAFIEIGEKLAPALIGLFEAGIKASNWVSNKLVPAFTSLNPIAQQSIIIIIAVAAAMGPLLIILGQMAIGVGALMIGFGGLGNSATVTTPKVGLLSKTMTFLNRTLLAPGIRGIKSFFAPALKVLGIVATATGKQLKLLGVWIKGTGVATRVAAIATAAYTLVKKGLMLVLGGGKKVILKFIGFLAGMVTAEGLGTAASGMLAGSLTALWAATGVGAIIIAAVAIAFAAWKFLKWAAGTDKIKNAIVRLKGAFGFLSKEEVKAQLITKKTNQDLGDVTPTADELREALGEAGVGGTVKELQQAMLNLSYTVGGLNQDEMYLITQRALALRDAGEDLTPELQRMVDVFDRQQEAAADAAAELEKQRQTSDDLMKATEDLRIELSGEGLLGELELLKAAWKELTPEQQANADTMKRAGEIAANLADEGVVLEGVFFDLAEATREVESASKDVEVKLTDVQRAAQSLADEISGKNLKKKLDAVDLALYQLVLQGDDTKEAMDRLGEEYAKLEDSGGDLDAAQRNLAEAFRKTKAGVWDLFGPMVKQAKEVKALADEWGDAGLANDVKKAEQAFVRLSEGELPPTELMLARVAKAALELRNRGAELSPEMDKLADRAEKLNGTLGDQAPLIDKLKDAWSQIPNIIFESLKGGGDAMKAIGSLFGSTLGSHLGDKLKGSIEGLTGKLGGMLGSVMGPLGGMAGSLLASGIGKAAGAISGWLGKKLFGDKTVKNVKKTAERMWGIALNKTAAKAAAEMTKKVGDSFTGLLLTLGNTIEVSGGVMKLGFGNVTKAARDTFSAIDQGKLTSEQALEGLLPVLTQLAGSLDQAGEEGTASFNELITLAQKFGLDMDAITAAIGEDLVLKALGQDLPTVVGHMRNELRTLKAEGLDPFVAKLVDLGVITNDDLLAITELMHGSQVDFQAMEEAANKYGIELSALGPKFDEAKLNDIAASIITDFDMLIENGADVAGVIAGMGDEVNALVVDAQNAGVAIPDNMRPIIDQMISMGTLVGANGEAITDMSDVNFAEPMAEKFDQVVDKLGLMIDKFLELLGLSDDVATSLDNIPSDVDIDIGFQVGDIPDMPMPHIEWDWDELNIDWSGIPRPEEWKHGTRGEFVNFGAGTPAILHGRERITPLSEAQRGDDGIGNLEKRLVSIERLLKDQPRAFGLAISDSLSLMN